MLNAGLVRRLAWTFALVVIALYGQAPQPRSTSPSKQSGAAALDALREKLAEQQKTIAGQAKTIGGLLDRINALESRVHAADEAELDPSNPQGYARLDSSAGEFLISIADVSPYLDGYKVALKIANLTSATFDGFTLQVTWGPKYIMDDFTVETYRAYLAKVQAKSVDYTDAISPGGWHLVELELPATKPEQMKYLGVSIKTNIVGFGQTGQ